MLHPIPWPTHGPSARFLVLSGPSGAGKTTLIKAFRARYPAFVRCLSLTTRPPRGSEQHGVDYLFTTHEAFQTKVEQGELLEHATVFGEHRYGTPRSFVELNLEAGRSVVKDIDVQGADQVRSTFPAALRVFVAPPSRAVLEERLRGRGTESEEAVARRLAEAERELSRWREFRYLVVNEDLERAVDDLWAIVRAAQLRIEP